MTILKCLNVSKRNKEKKPSTQKSKRIELNKKTSESMITVILRSDKSNKTFVIHLHPDDPIEKIWSILKMNGENYEMFRHGVTIRQTSGSTLKELNVEDNDVITFRKSPEKTKKSFEGENTSGQTQGQRSKTGQSFVSEAKMNELMDMSIREVVSDSAILKRRSNSPRQPIVSKSESPVMNFRETQPSDLPASKINKISDSGNTKITESIKEDDSSSPDKNDQPQEISLKLPNEKLTKETKKKQAKLLKKENPEPQWKLVCRKELSELSLMKFDVPRRRPRKTSSETNQPKFQVAELKLKTPTSDETQLETFLKSEDNKFETGKFDAGNKLAPFNNNFQKISEETITKGKFKTSTSKSEEIHSETKKSPDTNAKFKTSTSKSEEIHSEMKKSPDTNAKFKTSPSKSEEIQSETRKSTDSNVGSIPSGNTSRRVSKEPMVDKELFLEYLQEIEEKLKKKEEKKQQPKGILTGKAKANKPKHVQILSDKKIEPEVKKSVSPPKTPVKKAPSVSPPKVPQVKEPSPIREEITPEKDETSDKEVSPTSVTSNDEKSEGSKSSGGSEKQSSPRNASDSPAGSNEDDDT